MGKTVWLINQYAMPPQYEPRLRTIKFAHYLTEAGYDVTIFASSLMHNMNIDLITDGSLYIEKYYNDLHFVHIKTNKYRGNGIARVWSSIQFPSRFRRVSKNFKKPDIIINYTFCFVGNPIYWTAKKYKAKIIQEVLDLWPESFVELGIISKWNPLLYIMYAKEKWMYKHADEIVFSMEGGPDYLKERKIDKEQGGPVDMSKVHYINNGVDLVDFNEYKEQYLIDDSDLSNSELKKIIYIGSLRRANNVKLLIEAASFLERRKDAVFLIYGDGEDRTPLIEYCKENNICNVIFKDKWIDPKYVPYILTKSYVNILNYMPGHFGTYGGSQSKMFQYMASGKPICCNLEIMYCQIKKHQLGIAKEFISSREYANAIETILDMDKKEYDSICKRSLETAKEFDYKVLTDNFMRLI